MRTYLVGAIVVLIATVFPRGVKGDGTEDVSRAIDTFLSRVYAQDAPGAAVIAVKKGHVVFRGAYGMADLEQSVALTPDMVFRLGSITKQFTAAAILILMEQGKILVDDPITKFLPDYPVGERTITVAHLLSHTSGIKSYTGIPGYMAEEIKADLEIDELIDVFDDLPADFSPGESFRYNNSGYVLLGAIIEEASGQSYESFVDEQIFQLLDMKSSYYGNHERIIPRRVAGYGWRDGGWQNAPYLSMTQPHAAGSLLSTVDDLAKWDAALWSGEFLSGESSKKQTSPFSLNGGDSTRYAYGFFIGELVDHPMVSHGGGIHGFSTFAMSLPDDEIYVAVLTNSPGNVASPSFVARKIARMVMGKPLPERKVIDLDEKMMDAFVGVFSIRGGFSITVSREKGQLLAEPSNAPPRAIFASSETEFFQHGETGVMRFLREEGQRVTHLELVTENGRSHRLARRE